MDRYVLTGHVPVGPAEDIGAQERLRAEAREGLLVSQVAKVWPYGAGILMVFGAFIGSKSLFTLGALVGAALLVARLWAHFALRGLSVERRLGQTRAFFGEEVEVAYVLTNLKPLPVSWLALDDEIPHGLHPLTAQSKTAGRISKHLTATLALKWYERVTTRHRLLCMARGEYAFTAINLESGDIFGIFRRYQKREMPQTLIVYPRYVPVEWLGIPARQAFGEHKSVQRLMTDPLRLRGVREYAWGDSPRHVHWKATARRGTPQVKIYEPAATPQLFIFCNQDTFAKVWEGIDREALEFTITVAASLANHALDEGYMVGLQVNSFTSRSDSSVRLLPSRSPGQFTRILENLARVRGWSGQPIEELLRAERRRLPRGATLVVVTAVVTPDLVDVLAAIRRAGHPVVLVETAVEGGRGGVILRGVNKGDLHGLGITYHSVRARGALENVELIRI